MPLIQSVSPDVSEHRSGPKPERTRGRRSDHSTPSGSVPPSLASLLQANETSVREQAWAGFLDEYSRLILHVCRSLAPDNDAAMDGYAYALELLRSDNCRRLRAYVPEPNTRFSTWLVVVVRRLFRDYQRHRYGRPRSEGDVRRDESRARRRLEDLVAEEIDEERLAATTADSPDATIRRDELTGALREVLAHLDPPDRLLLALRFEDERPVREIAANLGLPTVFHVYRRLHAVLKSLRVDLAVRGVMGSEP